MLVLHVDYDRGRDGYNNSGKRTDIGPVNRKEHKEREELGAMMIYICRTKGAHGVITLILNGEG